MKVAAKTIAPCQQRLEIDLPPQAVVEAYDDVYHQIQREATIAGFRKGKAPRDLLEKHHGQAAREEVLKRLISDGIHRATEERQLQLVGRCDVSQVKLDVATGLQFTAEIEVAPEIVLQRYKDLPLRRPSTVIADTEVEDALQRLREHRAELVPATAGGEQKERQLPALDDAFAKDVGLETLDRLRDKVRGDLTLHKRQEVSRALQEQLFEALLAQSKFDVPSSLVARQSERLKRHLAVRLLTAGLSEEQAKAEMAALEQELATNALRQVKIRFLVDRIAQTEQINVTQQELVGQLWQLANRTHQDPNALRKQFDAEGLWDDLAADVRYEKTVDFLLRAAKIEDESPVVVAPAVALSPPAPTVSPT